MRLIPVLLLFVVLMFFPLTSLAGQATTIDELVKMYDANVCIECHQDIDDIPKEWKDSKHGNSIVDPNVLKTWRTFIIQGLDRENRPREWLAGCLQCHAPQTKDASPELIKHIAELVVTSVDNPDETKRESAIKELSKLNINCFACHNLNALGLYAKQQPKSGAIYVPKGTKDAIENHNEAEPPFETIKSDMVKKAEMCATCHHGCPEGIPSTECPTQYTSYLEHYIQKGGKETCQSCHMKTAEKEGKEYKSHKFLGSRDPKLFEDWVDIIVNARPTTYIDHLGGKMTPAVVVNVAVTNKAGHGIPHG